MRRRFKPIGGALVLAALSAAAGACGAAPKPVAGRPVPTAIVPAKLDPDLALFEYEPARARFAAVGSKSLVDQGRLYEVRRGDRLVGTLQVSTVVPSIKTMQPADRTTLLGRLMTGVTYETVVVDGVQVASARNGDRAEYVWFGDQLFQVLQLKDAKLSPDGTIDELIRFQRRTGILPAEPESPAGKDDNWP